MVVNQLPATGSRRLCDDEGRALRPVSQAGAAAAARVRRRARPAGAAARRAALLGELFTSVASAANECDVLSAAARHATEWIGDMCNIFMLSDDREWFELAANQAGQTDDGQSLAREVESYRMRARDGIAGRVLASGRPFYGPVGSQDTALLKRERVRFVARHPIASLVAVPMAVRDEIIGVFELARITDTVPYRPEDVEFIRGIASRTAMAYDNLRSRQAGAHGGDSRPDPGRVSRHGRPGDRRQDGAGRPGHAERGGRRCRVHDPESDVGHSVAGYGRGRQLSTF